jgi:hypothetical protein
MEPLIMHPSFHAFYLSNQNVARNAQTKIQEKNMLFTHKKNDRRIR